MDERYEIRGKIGQGGIGAVYRAYDKNLSREVAIKRILADGGAGMEKEATRQLTKDLSSLDPGDQSLVSLLIARNIRYRIFTTTVPIRAAKWSRSL